MLNSDVNKLAEYAAMVAENPDDDGCRVMFADELENMGAGRRQSRAYERIVGITSELRSVEVWPRIVSMYLGWAKPKQMRFDVRSSDLRGDRDRKSQVVKSLNVLLDVFKDYYQNQTWQPGLVLMPHRFYPLFHSVTYEMGWTEELVCSLEAFATLGPSLLNWNPVRRVRLYGGSCYFSHRRVFSRTLTRTGPVDLAHKAYRLDTFRPPEAMAFFKGETLPDEPFSLEAKVEFEPGENTGDEVTDMADRYNAAGVEAALSQMFPGVRFYWSRDFQAACECLREPDHLPVFVRNDKRPVVDDKKFHEDIGQGQSVRVEGRSYMDLAEGSAHIRAGISTPADPIDDGPLADLDGNPTQELEQQVEDMWPEEPAIGDG